MMDGYGNMMGAGGFWMLVLGFLAILVIAALIKYLIK